VRHTAAALATSGGLTLVAAVNAHPWPISDGRGILSKLTFGRLDDLMIKQFMVVAEAR
jgi:hypothetical protein